MLGISLPRWDEAMLACFHFELQVRLLASKYFPSESVVDKTADLLKLLYKKIPFAQDEKVRLTRCNQLRNKLIHCEPDALLKLVKESNPGFCPAPVVREVDIPQSTLTISKLFGAIARAVNVQSTSSRDAGFQGWMMESASNGTFTQVTAMLNDGTALLFEKAAENH